MNDIDKMMCYLKDTVFQVNRIEHSILYSIKVEFSSTTKQCNTSESTHSTYSTTNKSYHNNFDKNSTMSISNFNSETINWLGEWMSQTGNDRHELTNSLTHSIKSSLLNYMLEYGDLETYDLYRGVGYNVGGKANINTLSSWSLDSNQALNFGPNLIYTKVKKEQVLIDTTLFIPSEVIRILGGFPKEREVILLPGVFMLQ